MVKITGSSVVKTFKYLEAIYKLIETHSIPNTDKFVKAKDETVWLSPRRNVLLNYTNRIESLLLLRLPMLQTSNIVVYFVCTLTNPFVPLYILRYLLLTVVIIHTVSLISSSLLYEYLSGLPAQTLR